MIDEPIDLDTFETNLQLFNVLAKTNWEVVVRNDPALLTAPYMSLINKSPGSYEYINVSFSHEGLVQWWGIQLVRYGQYIDREVFAISERPWLDALVDALLTGMYVTATTQHRGKNAVGRYEAFQRLREVY